jgi:hypothetical protein
MHHQPLSPPVLRPKLRSRLARFSEHVFLLASTKTRLIDLDTCHAHPTNLLVGKSHVARLIRSISASTDLIAFDLVNSTVLITTLILKLNRETILVLIALSMCMIWIALDLIQPIDHLDPSPFLILLLPLLTINLSPLTYTS